ncbi:MAG: acyltransferase family protein, partial [Clostridia bacterium]|nr:acyltransferase family protein [Clostridia bacterium]
MLRPTGSETCGKLTNEQENTRNYGIDLLRIVSMFMVCLLHVLGNGGVLLTAAPQSVNFYVAEYVEIAAFCAVDCYALISGYIGIKSKYKVSNIISLWLQVVLYSVAISVSFVVLKPDTYTLETVIKSFFPVTFSRYWYFTAYFGLFLFKPLLDSALNSLSERQIRYSLIIIVLTFSILTIPNT